MPPAVNHNPGKRPKEGGSRRCWECIRKRLVCDCSRPSCLKCLNAGIECSGYGEKKPLTWLAPGRVSFRTRRQKKMHSADVPSPAQFQSPESSKLSALQPKGSSSKYTSYPSDHKFSPSPSFWSNWRGFMNNYVTNTGPPLATSDGGLRPMKPKIIVPRGYLTTETCDIVQAASYFNLILHQQYKYLLHSSPVLMPLRLLHIFPASSLYLIVSRALSHYWITTAPNRQNVWTRLLYYRGKAIKALNDEITNESALKAAKEDLNSEALCNTRSPQLMLSVMMMLATELQLSITQSNVWRPHFDALISIINSGGDIHSVLNMENQAKWPLLFILILDVLAATTSPPTRGQCFLESLGSDVFFEEIYRAGIYTTFPCPWPLFLAVMHTNRLRFRLASTDQSDPNTNNSGRRYPDSFSGNDISGNECNNLSFHKILTSITSFPCEAWARQQPASSTLHEWNLVASIFRSACAVFCILSLERYYIPSFSSSASSISTSPAAVDPDELTRTKHRYGLALLRDLAVVTTTTLPSTCTDKGIGSHDENKNTDSDIRLINPIKLKMCLAWPLVVAGVYLGTFLPQSSSSSSSSCCCNPLSSSLHTPLAEEAETISGLENDLTTISSLSSPAPSSSAQSSIPFVPLQKSDLVCSSLHSACLEFAPISFSTINAVTMARDLHHNPNHREMMKRLVSSTLEELGISIGSCLPRVARNILERFWSVTAATTCNSNAVSSPPKWDDCFPEEIALVI